MEFSLVVAAMATIAIMMANVVAADVVSLAGNYQVIQRGATGRLCPPPWAMGDRPPGIRGPNPAKWPGCPSRVQTIFTHLITISRPINSPPKPIESHDNHTHLKTHHPT
jgi:hypothetical protein